VKPRDDITGLLQAWTGGDDAAREELMPVVYGELRRRAAAHLRRERVDHTLQATALVHEAYLRLVDQTRAEWINRAQFFAIASQMMRRILVDHARAGKMAKRSGQWKRLTLDEDVAGFAARDVEILDLDRALTRLFEFDPRKGRVAEMRFFAGLSLHEIGQVLDISIATVERDWTAARAWLYGELTKKPGS
jgi:RNA polymerase sigma-70 factor, ECF subfamily